jgi:AmmeMemoRadiSam system protein B
LNKQPLKYQYRLHMSTSSKATRRATHAGSWYSDNAQKLSKQLTDWLNVVEVKDATTRAIIAPHAGYRYSGPSAAYAYKSLVTAAPQV